jgi:hypothetical protein
MRWFGCTKTEQQPIVSTVVAKKRFLVVYCEGFRGPRYFKHEIVEVDNKETAQKHGAAWCHEHSNTFSSWAYTVFDIASLTS